MKKNKKPIISSSKGKINYQWNGIVYIQGVKKNLNEDIKGEKK